MKVNYSLFKKVSSRVLLMGFTLVVFGLLSSVCVVLFPFGSFAQDGEAGIRAAADQVGGYFNTGCDLVYAIGAVVGLIGAVKVLCAMNVLAA